MKKEKETIKNGIQINESNLNSFSPTIPITVQEEINLWQYKNWIGEQKYYLDEAPERIKIERPLIPITKEELEIENRISMISSLGVKNNILFNTSRLKVILLYLIAICGLGGEYAIYSSVGGNILALTPIKSVLFGLLAIVMAKVLQLIIHPYIHTWIIEGNLKLKSITKRLLLFFVGLMLLSTLLIGVINIKYLHRLELINEYEYLSTVILEAEGDEDIADIKIELSQVEEKLNAKDSTWFMLVKNIGIGFLSFIAILAGSIIFSIADLYNNVLKIKNKLQRQLKKEICYRTDYNTLVSSYNDLRLLHKSLMRKFAEKEFLEKLLSAEREEDLKIQTQQ